MDLSIKELMKWALNFGISYYYRQQKIKLILNGFSYLGSGRHRFVFKSPNGRYVLKFPINYLGLIANCDESRLYRQMLAKPSSYNEESYAPCRLISGAILMMRYVKDISLDSNKLDSCPKWVNYVDCLQVGFLKDGKLVSYDYSIK
jgi:hypothetical protein